jgi:hypothetical protein
MAVMSIRIKDHERKLLKALASLEGRTMTEVVSELLGEYLRKRQAQLNRSGQSAEVRALMGCRNRLSPSGTTKRTTCMTVFRKRDIMLVVKRIGRLFEEERSSVRDTLKEFFL